MPPAMLVVWLAPEPLTSNGREDAEPSDKRDGMSSGKVTGTRSQSGSPWSSSSSELVTSISLLSD